jgi:uncharacterized membrane protein
VTDVPPPPPPPPPSFGAPPPGSSPDVGAALSYGWTKFGQNAGPLIIAFIIPAVGSFVLNILGSVLIRGTFGQILFTIVGIVVQAMLGIAIYRVALQITAGQKADIAAAFQYDRWGEWILFSVVYGLMIGFGLIFCLIPGLILLYFFALAPFFFLDQNMSLGSAFTASKDAVSAKGVGFPVLLCIVVGVLGLLACIIGVFVTAPLAYVAVAYLYRYAVGQPVAP